MYNRRALIKATQHAGAVGYILKDDFYSFDKLDQIILDIHQGDIYYSPEVERLLSRDTESAPTLTRRQSEILSYIASSPNLTTGQLAEQLNLAPSTIRNHLSDAYIRLGVSRFNLSDFKGTPIGFNYPGKITNSFRFGEFISGIHVVPLDFPPHLTIIKIGPKVILLIPVQL